MDGFSDGVFACYADIKWIYTEKVWIILDWHTHTYPIHQSDCAIATAIAVWNHRANAPKYQENPVEVLRSGWQIQNSSLIGIAVLEITQKQDCVFYRHRLEIFSVNQFLYAQCVYPVESLKKVKGTGSNFNLYFFSVCRSAENLGNQSLILTLGPKFSYCVVYQITA